MCPRVLLSQRLYAMILVIAYLDEISTDVLSKKVLE